MKQNRNITSRFICLILGGGKGTRLHPLTAKRSKPAVPIAGKYRLIDIPISNCLNSGINKIFVLTQFNSASLNRHIKNTYHFDNFTNGFVDILAAEQFEGNIEWFQGTADAVRQSVRNISISDFDYVMILSGDQLYQMDFEMMATYHVAQNAAVTIATIPVDAKRATSFGIMKVDQKGYINSFIEKPDKSILANWKSPVTPELVSEGRDYLASMGIYIFNRKALRDLLNENPNATDFGKELIPIALKEGSSVASYMFDGYWTDIGDIESFFEANIELANDIPNFNLFDNVNRIYTNARQLPPSKLQGTTCTNSIISEGCILHAKSIVNSVIGIRARIGENAVIMNTYVMGNDYYETFEDLKRPDIPIGIGKNTYIENAIIDKQARIGSNVIIKGDKSLEDKETDQYVIRDGIIVVKKSVTIPDGSKIGKVE
ncbi:MAG TPA: glucose-1-phosphate adenylyltransferase [Saprospiraceae bacterium]|nr:glucose-1-phosphate adenylyltransferase [Saprospiraceae bacterium]